jgi:hypothetical protein
VATSNITGTPVPTLSTFGWVTNPAEKADFLLVHFFYSEKNQTSIYGDGVSNLQWILEQNTGNVEGALSQIKSTINTYLGRYYDSVTVDAVTQEVDAEESSSRMEVVLNISVSDGGLDYSLNRLVSILNGRFKAFTTMNNEEIT